MTIHVRTADGAAGREACFAIRLAVSVDEQGVRAEAELDGHEPTATHLRRPPGLTRN